jgi:alpha-galactosidase
MHAKIAIIGAGSGAFSLSLIRDICLTESLQGCSIVFMDIDPARLEGAFGICRRYAQEMGVRLSLEKTLDRREALRGADFVINTALAAGHERLREGWEIAFKHGFRFGGGFHVIYDEAFWINFYQFRLFESLTEDILSICPNAWHLMVANPVISGVTHLARKYPSAKVVGLCHGYAGVYALAKTLGLDREGLTFEVAGVNHFLWITRLCYKGQDVFPLLDKWIEEQTAAGWKKADATPPTRKAADLYRQYGAFPIGDTAGPSGASWPWWYHTDREVEKSWDEPLQSDFWDYYFKYVKENADRFQQIAADTSVKVTEVFPPTTTDELIIPLVESIACDIPRILVTNILNSGNFVPGIPNDFEVEIPTLVSKRGIQGIRATGLPKPILAQILRDRIAPIEMELEAYNNRDQNLLRQMILMDKWCRSAEQADALIRDVLALPYHSEMREHYRAKSD